jgi:flagellar hook protein FlgE
MIGALWTGISGLAAQQKALDNESNNIANVNTIGYKASRISFADQLYQDKIGKGSNILDAEKLYTQGSLKLTGVAFDMALSGDGFFAVSNTRGSGTAETLYTRAGNFRMGDNGRLQDSAGNEVQGWAMSSLDTDVDIFSTNSNVKKFTNEYSKFVASRIIRGSTAIETITSKMTDYTIYAKTDDKEIMTGAGHKYKSTKISDIELLISSYSAKLQAYSSNPDTTSAPSILQNSWLNFDLANTVVDSGDQIYVYIDGTKYAQAFDTDEQTTMKKFVDQISNIPGINAYIGDSTSAISPSPTDTNGYIIINGLIPGKNITIGDIGIIHDNATLLKTSGTNTVAVEGTGYGAVKSAMEALKAAVAGKQRDVWTPSDIGTLNSGDKFTYDLTIAGTKYSISVTQGDDSVVSIPIATEANSLSATLTDANKIKLMAEAINADPTMNTKIVARDINGNLVIESLIVGEEFVDAFSVDYATDTIAQANDGGTNGTLETGETWTYALAEKNVNTDEEVQFKMTLGGVEYIATIVGGSKQATVTANNNNTITTTNVTLSSAVTSANIAEMMAYTIENGNSTLASSVVASQNTTTSTTMDLGHVNGNDGTDSSFTIGANINPAIKKNNSTYSVNKGAGAEFMQIKSTIDQTSSKGSLQLRLDSLGISDSAFGVFMVDSTGLLIMKQDGAEFAIAQVAIALFNDNRGLEPRGDNLLATTTRSGGAIYNINNNKTADIKSKNLELSTVELSTSLVNIMLYQRAFEANAKSITTADAILNTLINLKR